MIVIEEKVCTEVDKDSEVKEDHLEEVEDMKVDKEEDTE